MNDIADERKKNLEKTEDKKTREGQQKALKLQEKQKLRVHTEPNNSEKTVNLAVRHPELKLNVDSFEKIQ